MSKGNLGPGDGCSLSSVGCDGYAWKGQMPSSSGGSSSHCTAGSITPDRVNSAHQSILSTSIVSTLASFTATTSVTVAHTTSNTNTSSLQQWLKYVKTDSKSPTKLQRLSCIALRAMEQPVSVVATSCSSSKVPSANSKALLNHIETIMQNENRILNGNSPYLFTSETYTAQTMSSQKMTLMAELFASEDEDGENEVIYDDDIDPIDLASSFEHIEHVPQEDEVDYEDEEEDEDEDHQDDAAEDGDDENSEVESFILEDDPSLDTKYMLEIESNQAIPHSKNDILEQFGTTFPIESNHPIQLARVSKDSTLYRKLQIVTSDVHTVLDEVGETISKMRVRGGKSPGATCDLSYASPVNTANKNLSTSSSLPSKVLRAVRTTPDSCQKSSAPLSFKAVGTETANELDEKLRQFRAKGKADPANDHTTEMLQRKDVDKFLAYAAGIGAMDMVKFLLTSPLINLNKCSGKEMTPLMEAASNGHLEIVELLVEHGAQINFKSKQNNTALMFASAMGHLPIVRFLVNGGADIEAQNENGHTALMEAASAGHVEVVTLLVSHGANINVHSNEYKETALTLAAYKGHTEMVRYLLEVGAGQLHRGEEMHTALMEASMDGHVEVARLLLDSGAQVNMPPDSFESPLTLAACGGHVELALLLLQRGANIEEVNDEGYTALMEAAREGHEEMVALLLSHGAKVNATTEESKETALLMACAGGASEVVDLLIKADADIELGSNTPLIEAAQEGHLEIVKKLLKARAKINAINSSGETALTLASENGHLEIVKLLLSSGAKVDFCAEGGKTALMKAAQANRVEVVSQLIAAKADVNLASTNNEYTPLSLACSNGRGEVVEVLLQAGADPNHRLKDNSTMFIEAAKNGHVNVVQILIDYGQFYSSTGCVQQVVGDNQAPSLPKRPSSQQSSSQATSVPVSSASQAAKSVPTSNPPRVKMQKKMPPPPPTLIAPAPPQPVPSHIKLVGNPTLKVYPKPPASKKCSSYRKLYVPNCKKTPSSQVNIKHMMHQGNVNTINKTDPPLPAAIKSKVNRSLSDSFVQNLSSDNKMEANGLISLQLKPFPSPPPVSYEKPSKLAKHFMEQVSTVGPENSDLAGEIAAAFFYSIFNSFLKPHYKPPFTDDQLFGQLIEDILEILNSDLVDSVTGEWLDMRLKMIEIFQHFCQGRRRISEKLATDSSSDIDSQMDAVVPGWVLKKLCHNSKVTEKFCMQNIGLFDLCRMFKITTRNPYGVLGISDDLVEEMKLLDLLSTPMKHEIANSNDEDMESAKGGEIAPRHVDKATNVDQFAFTFENPEQAIFAVKNGTVFPLEYADDALFDIFIKAAQFFMSPEKDALLDDILKDLAKSPPNLQATMRPLFSQIQQKMQSVFIKGADSEKVAESDSNTAIGDAVSLATLPSENGSASTDGQLTEQETSQANPNLGHPCFSAFTIIKKPFQVASVMPDYPGDWSTIEPVKLADMTQVIELNSTKLVNASNSAILPSQKLLAFRNQVIAATLFISYTTDVCTEDMLRGHLSRATPIFSPSSIASSSMSEKATQASNELGFNPAAETLIDLLNTFAPVMQDERFAFFREKLTQLGLGELDSSVNQDSELTEADIFELPGSAAQMGIPQVLFPHEVLPGNSAAFTELMSNANTMTPSFVPFPTEFNFTLSSKTDLNCTENSPPLTSKDVEYINKCYKNFFSQKGVSKLKCAPSSSSSILLPTVQIQPTAATVSINTNTTSTPTTAVCVGTLMPQLPLPDSVSQYKPSTSASMQKLIQTTNFSPITTTTKSITKLKNSVSQSNKKVETATQDAPTLPAAVQHMHNPPAQRSLLKSRTTTTQTQSTTSKSKTSTPIDLNSQTDSNHDTALTVTCASGHEEMVKLLIQQGADIEHRDKKGHTPLMIAAINGFHKIVDLLANNGADLEAQTERTKDTALSLACSSGRYDVVEVLLLRGSNKEHRNVSDYTPLSLAASGGFVNVINLLLNSGAEINSRTGSKLGISPLMLAAMNGHTETVRLLLDKGSDINAYIETNKNTALTLACFQGRTEVVGLLLDRNANIEHRAKTGLTPLMEAASGGYVDVGRVLLEKGAEVNAAPVPASRDTALTIAADKGHSTFVELLVKGGAMVDVKNKKGYSPLWLACNGGHFEVANLLVNAKCDVDSQDNRKISCLMAAFRKGHVKLVKFMVRHVTQFPSEQEINRYMSICTDEDIKKKVMICSGIIRFAKDRQAQEANKNAANLLEEIDAERSREENRKAAAARRRERRKQKKKEKVDSRPADEDDKNDLDNEDHKMSGHVEGDDADDEDTTAFTIDEDDYDSFDELARDEDLQPPPPVIPQEPKKSKKKKKSKPVIEVPETPEIDNNPTPQNNPIESNNKKKDKKNKNKALSTNSTTNAITIKSNKEIEENVISQQQDRNVLTKLKSEDEFIVETAKVKTLECEPDDVSEDSTVSNAIKTQSVRSKTATAKKNDSSASNATIVVSSNGNSQGKREEGWKEVSGKKSKKVLVPANAISRVIGRAGCNINTIREVSGAHIEVEKQKGQGDRMVVIRGSADATRNAHQLITQLSKEADKDLAEIIRQLGLSKACSPPTSTVVSNVTTSTATSISTSSSVSENGVDKQACKQSNNSVRVSTASKINNATAKNSASKLTTSGTSDQTKSTYASSSNSNTSNTVSYTMAVNTKTRGTKSSGTSNGVKIMSAVFKPSHKAQNQANGHHSSRTFQPSNKCSDSASESSYKSPSSASKIPSDNESTKSESMLSVSSLKTEATCEFNTFSNAWPKQQASEKLNFASVAASGVSPISQSTSTSSINSKQNMEIIVDEAKAPGFNRHFASPGSFSSSSTSSYGPTLSINTATNSMGTLPQHSFGSLGNTRSAPCTPPMANCSPGPKFHSQQQSPGQVSELSSPGTADLIMQSKSQLMDSNFLSNPSGEFSSGIFQSPLLMGNSGSNNLPPGMFYPNSMSVDDSTLKSSNNQSIFNSGNSGFARSSSSYIDMNSPSAIFGGSDQQLLKSSLRSSLNPNAPDFASRSNSFPTNTLQQQPMLNLNQTVNSSSAGSNSSISSTGFGNVPPRPNYLPTAAPPISSTAVRAAIVNYSINVFGNQVPKQHQEAAARMAHLSAQNSGFVSNDFASAFLPNTSNATNNGNVTNQDKIKMYQNYNMYNSQQAQFKGHANSNGQASVNIGPPSPFGSSTRHSNSASVYSVANFTNSSAESITTSSNLASVANETILSSEDRTGVQRTTKPPAPIGTERAQKKNPANMASPMQSTTSNLTAFDQPLLNNWTMNNSDELTASDALLSVNRGLSFGSSLVGSDFNDFLVYNNENSLPFSQMNHSYQLSRQQYPSTNTIQNRLNFMDGFASSLDSSNSINNFKNLNNSTSNSIFGANFNHCAPSQDSDYWSSSATSSAPMAKPAMSNNSAFDSKIHWNNWNN